MQGVLIRFTGSSSALMSTAYQRDTANVEFGLPKRTDAYNKSSGNIAGLQAILQTMVLEILNFFMMTSIYFQFF